MIGKRPVSLTSFKVRARRKAAFAVFHGEANIGARLVAFFAGNRPDDVRCDCRREGDLRSVLFTLNGFDAVVHALGADQDLPPSADHETARCAAARGAIAAHRLMTGGMTALRPRGVVIFGPDREQPTVGAVAQKRRGGIFLAVAETPLGAEAEQCGALRFPGRV